ncbi:MAG: hypothetical protein ACJ75E_17945 [Actinomycetes bacterium]
MIGNDAIVFDGVAHVFNFEKKNALGPAGEMFINHLYAFHAALTPDGETVLPPGGVPARVDPRRDRRDGLPPERHRQAGRHAAALTDLFKDGLSRWEDCAELARRNPERTVFWGSLTSSLGCIRGIPGLRRLSRAGISGALRACGRPALTGRPVPDRHRLRDSPVGYCSTPACTGVWSTDATLAVQAALAPSTSSRCGWTIGST